MPRLPIIGNVQYNGIVFPPTVKSSVRIIPELDTAQRMVKYRTYYINVTTEFTADDFVSGTQNAIQIGTAVQQGQPLDPIMPGLRKLLLQVGKVLTFTGQGLGLDLTIDESKDVRFGPKPRLIHFRPLGGAQCVAVEWEVETTIIECDSGPPNNMGMFCFSMGFFIAPNGRSVRTINGEAEALVHRTGNGIDNTVDTLRDSIDIPLIDGFERTTRWDESEDKRSLRFSIIDEEIPSDNPYHPFMIRMRASHNMRSGLGIGQGGFSVWQNTIQGHIEIAPAQPRSLAWTAFLALVNDRINYASTNANLSTDTGDVKGSVIITDMDLTEEIYDNHLSFMVGYTVASDLQTILDVSGMWRPVPGAAWSEWSTSMAEIQGNRGVAGLKHKKTDDVLIDFCPEPITYPQQTYLAQEPVRNTALVAFNCPPQESSWLDYKFKTQIIRESGAVFTRFLGPGDSTAQDQDDVTDSLIGVDEVGTLNLGGLIGNVLTFAANNVKPNVFTDRGASAIKLIFEGYALRVGFHIPIPGVTKVNGQPAVVDVEQIMPSQFIRWSGSCPVYMAAWRRVYLLPGGANQTWEVDGVPQQYLQQE